MLGFRRQTQDNALLYFAHKINDSVIDGWIHLKNTSSATNMKPIFVYDNTRNDFDGHKHIEPKDVFLFSLEDVCHLYKLGTYDIDNPYYQGNTIFGLLLFWRSIPDFSYYWRIEYDVLIDGKWSDFLNLQANINADLMTTTITEQTVRPDWIWWSTFRKPWYVWANIRLYRCFMPVARLSRRACATISKAYASGWLGHDELIVPTILKHKGFEIADFGGDGDFVTKGNHNLYYSNSPLRRGLAPGTFVCPPEQPTMCRKTGMLYHPVKDRTAFLSVLAKLREAAD